MQRATKPHSGFGPTKTFTPVLKCLVNKQSQNNKIHLKAFSNSNLCNITQFAQALALLLALLFALLKVKIGFYLVKK